MSISSDWSIPVLIEPQQHLGSFSDGEAPPALSHQFIDADGNPVNLTGYTPTVSIETDADGATPGSGTPAISDAANGVFTYQWVSGDMTIPGFYRLLMWVSNGTTKLSSDVFTYYVYDGPGSAP